MVVPQGALVIEELDRAKDGIYLKIMDGGISRLRKLAGGKVVDVALPFDGTIGGVFAEADEDGVLINLSGWLTPTGVYAVDQAGKVADTGLTPKPNIDVSAYETKRAFASARDGVQDPYTLIYRKGAKLDGRNPVWVQAYGSYGAPGYTPALPARRWRSSMRAVSSATPAYAAAASMGASGTRLGSWRTSRTPGAT